MTAVVATLLAIAVAACWLASVATFRLSALARIHAVAIVNVVGGAAMAAAVIAADGATVRAAKAVMIWLAMLAAGAIGSHVAGRAIHLRDGTRR